MPNEKVPAGKNLAATKPTLAQIGSLIEKSGRWVAELRARGVMPPDGATLVEVVRAWGAYLAGDGERGSTTLDAERTRLTRAQAEAVERKNRQADDELIEMAEAEHILFEVARTARDAWLNWPSRTAPLIATALGVDGERLRHLLDEHVHQQISDLGDQSMPEILEERRNDNG